MTWVCIPFISSPVQGEESLQTPSSAIELLAQSKSSHIPERFCSHDSLTEAYLDSLFGMTCERSEPTTLQRQTTSSDCAELLATWPSVVDSRARTLAQQAGEKESAEKNPASGPNSLASFARFDRDTSSWRIPQCSLLGDSELYSETWPKWGLMRGGVCWELPTLVPRTFGSGSGYWPTPVAHDDGKTPEAHMRMKENMPGGARRKPTSLQVMAKGLAKGMFSEYLPTPTAQDARNNGSPSQQARNSKPLNTEAGGSLNPDWVEWLMGWPIGFTAPEPLEHAEPHPWADEPDIPRLAKGVKHRTARIKALGNGQVPQCAAAAWWILTQDPA